MGIVDRIRTGKFVKTLKSASTAPPSDLLEAKAQLLAVGDSAISTLLEILEDPEAREPATEILAKLLTTRTLPDYLAALTSPHRLVQSTVLKLLQEGERYDVGKIVELLYEPEIPIARIEKILTSRASAVSAQQLLSLLPKLGKDARGIAFRLLTQVSNEAILPDIKPLMEHEDWWIRLHVAKLLASFSSSQATDLLKELVRDENRSVRLETVRALGAIKDKSAVPELSTVLRDSDLTIQAAAIDALIEIADDSAVPYLIKILEDESEFTRRAAVEVLNEVATTDAIKDLVKAIRDADWWVRVRAADALGTIGGEKVVDAVLSLMDEPDDFIRRYAVEILNSIPSDRSVGCLIKALGDADWWVRERSIDALGKSGNAEAVEPLIDAMMRDERATPLCVRALGQLKDPRAVGPLIDVLEMNFEDEVKNEALEILIPFARVELPAEDRARLEALLEEHGIRAERTRLRPMEVRHENEDDRPDIEETDPDKSRMSRVSRFSQRSRVTSSPKKKDESAETAPAEASAEAPAPAAPAPSARVSQKVQPGTLLLERYRVIRKIGSGGFGTVYLAEDQHVGDEMILKILSPQVSLDVTMNRRFVQELKFARRITHRNVIRIHDLLQLGDVKAISMEYFAGKELKVILQEETNLPPARGIAIARQVCAGLGAAHEAGIIHRDVKPANLLVGDGDEVKIVDFGLASVGQKDEARLTKTGLLVGTPHYMSPEQIRGEDVDVRADIYALGIVMYEMFSGSLPYDGENAVSILFRHLDGDAPPLKTVAEGIPDDLSDLVMRCIAADPEGRPATADALAEELGAIQV